MNVKNVKLLVVACSLLVAANCAAQQTAERVFNPRVLMKPVRAIVDPPVLAAAEVNDEVVSDNELVLGVVVAGEARAFPVNMLCGPRREIVNCTLGGRAIAATW